MTADDLKLLIVEIEGEIEHFRQLQVEVAEAIDRTALMDEPEIYDLRSIAMLLTEIYMGAENLMRRIAKRLRETIPSGEAWHQQLLAQFSAESPNAALPFSALRHLHCWMNFGGFATWPATSMR